jgi:hypothetical protein
MRCAILALSLLLAPAIFAADDGWISLWNGKTFDGWKASENQGTFTIKDGEIVAKGSRSHLYYVGDVNGAEFKNFELKIDVKTHENSNGGIYFHTKYQQEGWPDYGFEVQVNNSHKDFRRTGGLYAVEDVIDISPAKDHEWFTEHIIVNGDHVVIKVDGKVATDWTQPAGWMGANKMPNRKIGTGTIALQGHDPGSVVHFKNIRIKPLP